MPNRPSPLPQAPPPRARRVLVPTLTALAVVVAVAAAPAAGAAPAPSPVPSPSALQLAQTPAAPVPILPLDQVRRGQKGYGLSVFEGQELERFDAEVLGVVRNTSPGQSIIIMRLAGQGLENTGIIAGMSGSPVYIDGKLVGAVAFAFPFAKEPIAGVTPIESMREATGAAAGVASAAATTPVPDVEALLHQPGDSRQVLEQAIAAMRPSLPQGTAAIEWGAAGFGRETQSLLSQALGPMMAGGEAAPESGPPHLDPGAAVAAVLVDGDLRIAATGTVTDRFGDQVLAFGHPFLGLGNVDVPMAEAEIVAVLPNQYNSFKIANTGRIVGAFEQDRSTGIRGAIGATAPMIPVRVHMKGATDRTYQMRIAEVPQLTPTLLAISMMGAQEAAATSAGSMGLDMEARFDLGALGTLDLHQAFDGDNAATDAAVYLLTFGRFLLQNAFGEVPLEGVDLELQTHPEPRTAVLVGGYADRTQVRPGDQVKVHLDMVPFRGKAQRRDLTLRLPVDLPAGRYSLLVGDGASIDAARLQLESASPVRLDQALRLLRHFHSKRDLVLLGVTSGNGLSVAGEVLPRLPGSVQSVWTAAASRSAVPLGMTVAQEQVESLDLPLEGAVRIDLKVMRREPFAGAEAATQPADDGSAADGESDDDAGAITVDATVDAAPGDAADDGGPHGASTPPAEPPG